MHCTGDISEISDLSKIYINREMMTIVSTLLETLATLDVTKMMDARCIGQVARTSQ